MKDRFTLLCSIACLPIILFSGTPEASKIPTRSEAAAIIAAEMLAKEQKADARKAEIESVEALEEWEINRDGRKVILRRTTPPPSTPASKPQTIQPEWTEGQIALWMASQPESRAIHLRAYVYDRSATEVIWRDTDGKEWKIISNVDFNYLTGIGNFEDETYVWRTFMMVQDVDTAAERARVLLAASQGIDYSPRTAPDESLFRSTAPEYLVYAESKEDVPVALYEELDALHQYYYANKDRLVAEYERRKVLNEARQEWHKANPPESKDSVINFWKVK